MTIIFYYFKTLYIVHWGWISNLSVEVKLNHFRLFYGKLHNTSGVNISWYSGGHSFLVQLGCKIGVKRQNLHGGHSNRGHWLWTGRRTRTRTQTWMWWECFTNGFGSQLTFFNPLVLPSIVQCAHLEQILPKWKKTLVLGADGWLDTKSRLWTTKTNFSSTFVQYLSALCPTSPKVQNLSRLDSQVQILFNNICQESTKSVLTLDAQVQTLDSQVQILDAQDPIIYMVEAHESLAQQAVHIILALSDRQNWIETKANIVHCERLSAR